MTLRRRLALFSAVGSLFLISAPASAQVQPSEVFGIARVTGVSEENPEDAGGIGRRTQEVTLLVEHGPGKGNTVTIETYPQPDRPDTALAEGDRVAIVTITNADGSTEVQWRERYRLPRVLWLCAAFVALALLLGRRTGFSALVGLAVSVLIIATVIVPQIAAGRDPLMVSLLGATAIACTSLYLAHGFSRRTTVALLSTLISLALSVLMAILAVQLSFLFGMGSEESLFLQMGLTEAVNLRGLLLGGIVIGCLGVLDDITTAQTAVISELRKANPSMSPKELLLAGLSVGREHIASLINTLALAYAGAALPLLLLFQTEESYPLWLVLNSEGISEEIIRTLVGSATLLLAVPISTWMAVVILKNTPVTEDHRVWGHRH